MNAAVPPLVQDAGIPLDLFIQTLTEQLDKAQASMAIKARIGKLPLTFAVKDVSLDLRTFVNIVDDDIYLRPAGPGDAAASTMKFSLTTITKSMVEENAVSYEVEDTRLNLKEALGDQISDEEQRRLERIGVRTVTQLDELKKSAGADVIARLARLPVNRLQQALLSAAAPRVTKVESPASGAGEPAARVHLRAPGLRGGVLPQVRAAGLEVPVVAAPDGGLVLAPLASQLGCEAELDYGNGEVGRVALADGSVGRWEGR
ncbi:hypothetical protein [Nevskia sp.]|uniref:hypothetical protein n=1 Tax=Nevskia sp. TaxID=1929292 RepID=UPI0025F208F5|nr:hypothetical protein [Nevskia sp.]